MIENAAHAFDNGKTKAKARRVAVMIEALELLENHVALIIRNSRSAVVNLYDQIAPPPAATKYDAAFVPVIFERIRDEILKNPAQKLAVGPDQGGGWHNGK